MTESNALFEKLSLDWHCPACGRARSAVPRINERRIEIAKAAEHHDHITNYTNSTMRETHGSDWVKKVPPGLVDYLNKIEKLVMGFVPTVVCEDCNNAETRAKQIVKAPKFFSFAPSEIQQFVKPSPNVNHTIDARLASVVYTTSKARYDLRFCVAERLLKDALVGVFWTTLK